MIRTAIMADVKNLSPEIILHIAQSLNLPLHSLTAVIGLLNEGGTVPFIARYRKEATGNLDEVQIRDIEDKLGLLSRARQPSRNYPRLHPRTGQAQR
jgi:transcriptional accessory protein Tex/SPT6